MPQAGSAPHTGSDATAAAGTHAGCTLSEEAQRLARVSIASTTAATYAGFVTRYREWCSGQHIDPAAKAVTAVSLANFIAAVQRQYAARTLGVIRSAIGHYRDMAFVEGPRPSEDLRVRNVIVGAKKERARAAALDPQPHKPRTPALTMELLERIDAGPVEGLQHAMMRAAARVAVHGLLRPSEFLGTNTNRHEALRVEAVQFYAAAQTWQPVTVGAAERGPRPAPHHFTLALGVTKADAYGTNAALPIAARTAVEALWDFMHVRAKAFENAGVDGSLQPLFSLPSCKYGKPRPLSCDSLLGFVARRHAEVVGGSTPAFTSRSYRRGGASSHAASGMSLQDTMAAGRWKSEAMPAVYSDADAKYQQQLLVSQHLGEVACAAAAAQRPLAPTRQ